MSPFDYLDSREMEKLPDSSFYRIILPNVEQNKLELPERFSDKYGDELSKVLRLSVPAGGIWEVELEKIDNVLMLSDGWQKFMGHNSILPGYFLLFKYRGNSEFNVNVFDFTATEIQYPPSSNSKTPGHDDDDASVTILDSPFPNKRFRSSANDASTGCLNKVSRRRTKEVSPINLDDQSSRSTDALELESSLDLNQETCSKRHKSSPQICSKRPESTALERERALNAAKLCKSVNPSFIVPLRIYNVHNNYIVHLPAKFSREYLQHCPPFIELQDSNNKKWRIRCLKLGGKIGSLSKGWSEFVKKEELKVGDVCVFELIQTNNVVLKVTIFRAKND